MALGADNDITMTIRAKDEATAAITGVQTSMGKLAGAFALGNIAANVFSATMKASTQIFTSSIAAYREAETAQVRLEQVLRTSTGASQEQINVLLQQADALEKVGVVSGETINVAQGTFATFDLAASSIERLTPAFLDMVVAERGVNATTGDMISYANGLGQALQGNYQALSQRGFILDAATKSIIAHGTETERVNAIVGVLDSTYKGMNETMRNTSEGAAKAATMTFDKMKEQIGAGLTPVLSNLTSNLMGVAQQMLGTKDLTLLAFDAFRAFAEVSYLVVNAMIQLGAGIAAATVKIANFITTMLGIRGLKKEFEEQETAIGEFANASSKGFEDFVAANEKAKMSLESMALKGAGAIAKLPEATGRLAEKANKDADKVKDKYKDLAEALTKVRQTATDELSSLTKSHQDAMTQSSEKMDDLRKNLRELGEEYARSGARASAAFAQTAKDEAASIADSIVAQERKIEDLKRAAGLEKDPQKRINLEAELRKEEEAYLRSADFIKGMDGEVAEAKRRAGLTEIERQIEEYKAKRAQAEQEFAENRADALREYNAKTAEIKLQQAQEQKKLSDLTEKFAVAQSAITKTLMDAETMRLNTTKASADQVIKLVDAQIAKYNQLSDAIVRASQGKAGQVSASSVPVSREFGGIVPGPIGTPVPIIAHGGEMVVPQSQVNRNTGVNGGVTININSPQVNNQDDVNRLRNMVEEAFRDVHRVHKLAVV